MKAHAKTKGQKQRIWEDGAWGMGWGVRVLY